MLVLINFRIKQTNSNLLNLQGHIKTVEKLLSLGAGIFTKNNNGENVFHIACRCVQNCRQKIN